MIFPGIAPSDSTLASKTLPDIEASLGNEFGALVGLSIAAFFGAAQPLILSFPLERPVFLREYSANTYSIVSYFLSKTLVEVVAVFGQNLLLFLITYFVLGLRGNFFLLLLSTWLMAVAAASLALWIGCAVSSPQSAIQLMPAVAVPQILFSGLFLKSSQVPVYL